jgi:hypothetical protein
MQRGGASRNAAAEHRHVGAKLAAQHLAMGRRAIAPNACRGGVIRGGGRIC